jgi:hypothetical protein
MRVKLTLLLLVLTTSIKAQNNTKVFENVKSLFENKKFDNALIEINNLLKKGKNLGIQPKSK